MRILLDLKNQRKTKLDEARAALEAKNMETYEAKMTEVTTLNAEIDAREKLLAEEGRFDEGDEAMVSLHDSVAAAKADQAQMSALNKARSGNEYVQAWAKAMRNGASLKRDAANEEYKPLYNALTIGGGTPAGSDGGFLVPIDFDDMIHRLMKDYVRLADYFRTESVTTFSGWRAVEASASRQALPQIDELATIGKKDQPKFNKVEYSIKKYGDRVVVSSELIDDNSAGLMRYLAEWFAPKVVMTENLLLLALVAGLTPVSLTAGSEFRDIKTALNTGLNTANSRRATILTNAEGYDIMDGWEDTTGRGLLVPNPADPDVYRLKGRQVVYGDMDIIPNIESGDVEVIPVYIGNFLQTGTLFRREAFEFATTNIGGDAWVTDSTEVRGICRMDAQVIDKSAALLRTIAVSDD